MRCSANYHCTLDEVAAAHYDLAEAITCCPAGEGAAREEGTKKYEEGSEASVTLV